jgi:hypothetical protein
MSQTQTDAQRAGMTEDAWTALPESERVRLRAAHPEQPSTGIAHDPNNKEPNANGGRNSSRLPNFDRTQPETA